MQHVVQLIRIPHIGPGFFPHLLDGGGIKFADFFKHRLRQHPPHLNRPRASFLQRSVVEIGIRIRIQNFVRELRRHRRVHRDAADAAILHAAQEFLHAFDIHGLGEDIFHHFLY